ncbi:MAG: hypothetical protein GWN58_46285 [Anaerolineae bacterium]|nr:hypothetical protein [Anaerolineae bacterium]
MRRNRLALPILILVAALFLAACSVSLPQGASGYIALMPFWDEEQGIQGVQPLEGWDEDTRLVQAVLPAGSQEAVAQLLAETALTALPESTGTYTGKAFTWDLYTFESRLEGAPVDSVHFDLAMTETESGTVPRTYIVMLLSLPDHYQASPELYDSVFTHVVYALEPME